MLLQQSPLLFLPSLFLFSSPRGFECTHIITSFSYLLLLQPFLFGHGPGPSVLFSALRSGTSAVGLGSSALGLGPGAVGSGPRAVGLGTGSSAIGLGLGAVGPGSSAVGLGPGAVGSGSIAVGPYPCSLYYVFRSVGPQLCYPCYVLRNFLSICLLFSGNYRSFPFVIFVSSVFLALA